MSTKQDLRAHLALLEEHGLLRRVTRRINKDTELMPLVRWQFRGLAEEQRTAFLFENVTNGRGEDYDGSVAVGLYAANTAVYSLGMGVQPEGITERWQEAQRHPLTPRVVVDAPVHEEVHMGDDLLSFKGIEEFPIPISTPGFDIAPYTTASNWVTRDPETGWINVGNYRGQVKGPERMGMFASPRTHGWKHWDVARQAGVPLEAALVIGGPPAVTFTAGARIPHGVEEYAVAGGLIGEPIDLVQCLTVDLLVPAYAEIVLEGRILTDCLEPEAPFGEYTGYMGGRVFNCVFEITAVTHRRQPVFCALMSQMPPSESSKMKEIAQNNNYLYYLRNDCNLPQVKQVVFAEIAMDSWCVIQLGPCNTAVAWQALYAVLGRNSMVGKMVIAVDEDIDPRDPESVIWAMSYRVQPGQDMKILPNRSIGLDPSGHPPRPGVPDNTVQEDFGSACLVNAMRSFPYPPVSLPARQYMEEARVIWEELGLPELNPRAPWHGYELGDWSSRDREEAEWAAQSEYSRTGDRARQQRRPLADRDDHDL
jgi:4-hydroxy-3-polyprenylbenzoate decarboxylase